MVFRVVVCKKLLQNQYWILQIQIKNKIENKIKLFQESTATHTKIEIKILTQQTTRKEKKTALDQTVSHRLLQKIFPCPATVLDVQTPCVTKFFWQSTVPTTVDLLVPGKKFRCHPLKILW